MAKLECELYGDFDTVLRELENGVLSGSVSASLEDGGDFSAPGVRCAVRVFERYSALGGNRVSLNLTLLEAAGHLWLSAIAAGGSQAMFFKLNTFGEEAFLDSLRETVERCAAPPLPEKSKADFSG